MTEQAGAQRGADAARILAELEARSAPMGLGEFWGHVAELGWGSRIQGSAAAGVWLAKKLTPLGCASMRARFQLLDAQLERAIRLWELQHEESVGLPPVLQRSLRAHIIGLGEIPYGLALQGPFRVQHRAERDDYLEGFETAFDLALRSFDAPALEAALA